jgi:glucose/arabinose dehydrogenase
MRASRLLWVVANLAIVFTPESVWAAIAGLQRVASGLNAPIFVTHAPGDRDRLFIAQRGGAIRILDLNTGTLQATPFLTMTGLSLSGEGGFLGMAFHPDYFVDDADGEGKFYVKVTTGSPFTARIREFTVSEDNPNLADPDSLREVLSYTNPQTNHVGGWIGFSPDNKYLYIANGDGGGANDSGAGHTPPSTDPPFTGGNAQDLTSNFLGKILRIDPIDPDPTSGPNYAIPPTNPFVGVTGDDEIWAYGLRNPFRAGFDRIEGDLWIGDVGQDNREEIDFQPSSSPGGENYGWRLREGDIATPTGGVGGAEPANHTPPIYAYTHPDTTVPPVSPPGYTGNLVTGGYVYRGPDPSLQGKYFFLDAGGNNHWMANSDPFGSVTNIDSQLIPNTGTALSPVSFGEDAKGNLYIAYIGSGEVYRIATNALLSGDFDADGDVDIDDYEEWGSTFGGPLANPAAEGAGGNGIADAADYITLRKNLGASVHAGAGSGGAVPEPATAILLFHAIGVPAIFTTRRRTRN